MARAVFSRQNFPDVRASANAKINSLFAELDLVAGSMIPVLIQGETGTGKELVANYIHGKSDRSRGPFVAINCAGIDVTFAESILFGHKKGAFTGAIADKQGACEMASGGTLFLDELNELRTDVQAKLLRALENHKIFRLGDVEPITVDFRLISATGIPLDNLLGENKLRLDMVYRLCGYITALPPLRERKEDLSVIVSTILTGIPGKQVLFADDVLDACLREEWVGNIRQLRRVLELAACFASYGTIALGHFQRALENLRINPTPAKIDQGRLQSRADVERIREILASADPSSSIKEKVELAAARLGMSTQTVYRRLSEQELTPKGLVAELAAT